MKRLATTVLCLLSFVGCSGWVVVISPTAIGCSTNVNIIPSPTRPPSQRTMTSAESVNSACVVADEPNVAVAAQGSGRSGVTAESVGPSEAAEPGLDASPTTVENSVENKGQESSVE
jgi:hypothetical protein